MADKKDRLDFSARARLLEYMFGAHVRELRNARELEQYDLAEQLGYSVIRWRCIECATGNVKLRLKDVEKIAAAFQSDPETLLKPVWIRYIYRVNEPTRDAADRWQHTLRLFKDSPHHGRLLLRNVMVADE